MKLHLWILTFIVCLMVWSLTACSRQEPTAEKATAQQSAEQPPAAQPTAPSPVVETAAEVTTGELQNVDLQAKTLTIKDATGKPATFSFTDSTQISGDAGAQGLTGKQGSQVTVRYVERDGGKTAVSIETVPK
jgi:hypothetical protein